MAGLKRSAAFAALAAAVAPDSLLANLAANRPAPRLGDEGAVYAPQAKFECRPEG